MKEKTKIIEGISSGKSVSFQVGDEVKVHSPGWTDAAGHYHPPFKNHGKTGTVAEINDGMVGDQRLYRIEFDDSTPTYPHWTNELKLIHPVTPQPNKSLQPNCYQSDFQALLAGDESG